ncbi:MAG: serine hydrolase domain-containing protein [Hyphomonadaceae bacterium]
MAEIEGFVAPGFEPVREAFAANFDEGGEIGAAFAAIQDGRTIADLWGGHTSRKRDQAWARDTIVPIYSATKPIAAFIAARLIDTDGVDFDAPVARVWPEFGAEGKGEITIAQALSHQAGLAGFADPIDPALWLDPPALAAKLAETAPLWPPGSASGYHPLTWGYIAGEIVRRATGRTLGAILREDICAPRGVDFWIGLPDEHHARSAEIARPTRLPDLGPITPIKQAAFLTKWAAPDRGGAAWRRTEIPSGNGHGTARATAFLYSLYAEGGALGGEQMLSPIAYDALTRPRIDGQDLVLPFHVDWRAGIMGNSNGFYGPDTDTLGHSGWGGSCGFGDAKNKLSAAYVMNRQSHHLMGDPRPLRIIEALYSCL